MNNALASYLTTHTVTSDIGPSTRLSLIKMNTCNYRQGSLVALLFVDDAPTPGYVTRTPRGPEAEDRVERNYRALHRLSRMPAMRGTVPAPVFFGRVEGTLRSVETCLDGSQLSVNIEAADRENQRERSLQLVDCVFQWLWRLHSSAWSEEESGMARTLARDIRTLQACGMLLRDEAAVLERTLVRLPHTAFRSAWCHNDLNPNNVLLLSHSEFPLGVVDWEYAGNGCAVLEFMSTVHNTYLWPARTPSTLCDRLESLFDRGTDAGRALGRNLDLYARACGVDREGLRSLFSLYLVRLIATHLPPRAEIPRFREGDPAFQMLAWEMARRARLFGAKDEQLACVPNNNRA